MNMSDIASFVKVAECLNFSKAASELYITQQAVSLHIKHLESTYNTVLFERRPRLKLTKAGEILLAAAQDIAQREKQLKDELTFSKEQFTGDITIGMPANRSTAFICEFLPHFSEIYPNMSVQLIEKYSTDLPNSVIQNEVDLALPLVSQNNNAVQSPILEQKNIESENLYLVVSDKMLEEMFPDNYPECKQYMKKGISIYDFASVPMFLHPSNSAFHRMIFNDLLEHGYSPYIRIKTALTSLLVSLCTDGYGIFFSPTMLVKYIYKAHMNYISQLNFFPIIEYNGRRETHLVYHKNKKLSQPLKDAINIIEKIYYEHMLFDRTLKGE